MVLILSRRWFGVLGVVVLMLSGCEGKNTHFPVAGKVTVDGKPLPDAQLRFLPYEEKENPGVSTTFFSKVKDGNYSLVSGAPAGWYKVIIMTQYPGGPAKPEVVLPQRYSVYGMSGLSVQVKRDSAPGDYDLKVLSR